MSLMSPGFHAAQAFSALVSRMRATSGRMQSKTHTWRTCGARLVTHHVTAMGLSALNTPVTAATLRVCEHWYASSATISSPPSSHRCILPSHRTRDEDSNPSFNPLTRGFYHREMKVQGAQGCGNLNRTDCSSLSCAPLLLPHIYYYSPSGAVVQSRSRIREAKL